MLGDLFYWADVFGSLKEVFILFSILLFTVANFVVGFICSMLVDVNKIKGGGKLIIKALIVNNILVFIFSLSSVFIPTKKTFIKMQTGNFIDKNILRNEKVIDKTGEYFGKIDKIIGKYLDEAGK